MTELQNNNPQIKRIISTCRSEYACMKEKKKEKKCIARAVTKRDIKYKDYDGAVMSDRRVNVRMYYPVLGEPYMGYILRDFENKICPNGLKMQGRGMWNVSKK